MWCHVLFAHLDQDLQGVAPLHTLLVRAARNTISHRAWLQELRLHIQEHPDNALPLLALPTRVHRHIVADPIWPWTL
eukprot:CAMPEP_0180794520 /NCGR_PEP_ID=MMETSP1038_2-20121128/55666_1 /TAXON_ID=632150 /ORGANISM="Azadinium spinosum, Strain 3D9" /LENGTH=76 /DNA_ID=CAMNT_0022833291 /DNA_START=575 /DNA_END=801 /DNA_ORIENTATION=+